MFMPGDTVKISNRSRFRRLPKGHPDAITDYDVGQVVKQIGRKAVVLFRGRDRDASYILHQSALYRAIAG